MNDYSSPDTDPMIYHEYEEYEDQDAPKLEQDDDYIDEM